MHKKNIVVFCACVHTNMHVNNSVYHPISLVYVLVQPCSLACGTMVPSSWHRKEDRYILSSRK